MVTEASNDQTLAAVNETEDRAAVTVVIEAVTKMTHLLVESEEIIVVTNKEAPLKGLTNTKEDPHHPTEE